MDRIAPQTVAPFYFVHIIRKASALCRIILLCYVPEIISRSYAYADNRLLLRLLVFRCQHPCRKEQGQKQQEQDKKTNERAVGEIPEQKRTLPAIPSALGNIHSAPKISGYHSSHHKSFRLSSFEHLFVFDYTERKFDCQYHFRFFLSGKLFFRQPNICFAFCRGLCYNIPYRNNTYNLPTGRTEMNTYVLWKNNAEAAGNP